MTTRGAEAKRAPLLPGDCLPIPQVTTEVRGDHGEVLCVLETHVVAGLDLDGCGSPVVLVPPDRPNLNPCGVWWRLFIQRGDCGYELGVVIGMGEPVREPDQSRGWYNFSVVEPVGQVGDGMQGIGATTYVFDGERYVGGRTEYR